MNIYDNLLNTLTVIVTCLGMLGLIFIILNKFTDDLMFHVSKKEQELKEIKYKEVGFAYLVAKRLFDFVFSFVGIILLIPMLPFLALAVKLDSPGPIFFRQKRYGLNKKVFYTYKFRTLQVPKSSSESNRLVQLNDMRITRIGFLLRKTGLDELTLFFNVLKGDMSLIGRSRAVEFIETGDKFSELYNIKPGLVSLWSISVNRLNTYSDDVLYLDLLYASIRSSIFDTLVFLRSIALGLGFIGDFRYRK